MIIATKVGMRTPSQGALAFGAILAICVAGIPRLGVCNKKPRHHEDDGALLSLITLAPPFSACWTSRAIGGLSSLMCWPRSAKRNSQSAVRHFHEVADSRTLRCSAREFGATDWRKLTLVFPAAGTPERVASTCGILPRICGTDIRDKALAGQ